MNAERLAEIVDYIKAHPKEWDQTDWHCGTTHCVAGFAQINKWKAEGKSPETIANILSLDTATFGDGARWLGLDYEEAELLFDGNNSLEYLEACVEAGVVLDPYSFSSNEESE